MVGLGGTPLLLRLVYCSGVPFPFLETTSLRASSQVWFAEAMIFSACDLEWGSHG